MTSSLAPPHLLATPDPSITARVVRQLPLHYVGGANPELDQPPHVRAGSGMARIGEQLVVVQDDANFLALLDPASGEAQAVPLPPGEDRQRQFDDGRGNKHLKLDLEACFVAPDELGEPIVVAIGSGSTRRRERIVTARAIATAGAAGITVHDAATLYTALRADPDFAPGEMNVEGAVYVEGRVRLFGRGNGAARAGSPALDTICELDWAALRAYLADSMRLPAPAPGHVVQYTLGWIDDLRLGFTDATLAGPNGSTVVFSAAAEDSPDATRDGRVAGSAIGVLAADGRARWTVLLGADNRPFAAKVEGVLAIPGELLRLHAVIDQDDPNAPSELCELELAGPWFRE